MQPRERPFNLIASKPQQKAYVELDLKKAYRHALTHPMDGWCVFSPTDSFTEPTEELAPLSWVEAKEATNLRENGYLGKGWYHRPLLRFLLQEGHVSPSDIKLSWWPTRLLPADTFAGPVARLAECLPTEWGERFHKSLVNKFVGQLISEDEPVSYKYFASTDPEERPPNAMRLPYRLEDFGVHEWAQRIEKRSYDSVRPIHSMVMQVARLRMNLLARYLRRTLMGWQPKYACQAKTDAWKCAVPQRLMPDNKNLRQLTYR